MGSNENLALSSVPVPNLNKAFPNQKANPQRMFFPEPSFYPREDKEKPRSTEMLNKLPSPKYSIQNFQPPLPAFSPPGSARSALFTNSAVKRGPSNFIEPSDATRPSTRALSIVSIDEQVRIEDDQVSFYGDVDDRHDTNRSSRKTSLADKRNQFRSRKVNPDAIKRSFDSENAIRLSTDENSDNFHRALSPHIESPPGDLGCTAGKVKSSESILNDMRSPTRLTPHSVLPPIGTHRDVLDTPGRKLTVAHLDENKIEKLVKDDSLKDKLKSSSKPAEFLPDDPEIVFDLVLDNKDKSVHISESKEKGTSPVKNKTQFVSEQFNGSKSLQKPLTASENSSSNTNSKISHKNLKPNIKISETPAEKARLDLSGSQKSAAKAEGSKVKFEKLTTEKKSETASNIQVQESKSTQEQSTNKKENRANPIPDKTESSPHKTAKIEPLISPNAALDRKTSNSKSLTNQNEAVADKIQKPQSSANQSEAVPAKEQKQQPSTNQVAANSNKQKTVGSEIKINSSNTSAAKPNTNQVEAKTKANESKSTNPSEERNKKTSNPKALTNQIEAVPVLERELSKSAVNAVEREMSEKEKTQKEVAQNFNKARQKSTVAELNSKQSKSNPAVGPSNAKVTPTQNQSISSTNERPKAAVVKSKQPASITNNTPKKTPQATNMVSGNKSIAPNQQKTIPGNSKVVAQGPAITRNPSYSKIQTSNRATVSNTSKISTDKQITNQPGKNSTSSNSQTESSDKLGATNQSKKVEDSKNTVSYRFDGTKSNLTNGDKTHETDASGKHEERKPIKDANNESINNASEGLISSQVAEQSQQEPPKTIKNIEEKQTNATQEMPKNVQKIKPEQSKNDPEISKPSLVIKNAMDSISQDAQINSQAAFESEIKTVDPQNSALNMPSRKLELSKTSIVSTKPQSQKPTNQTKPQTSGGAKKPTTTAKPPTTAPKGKKKPPVKKGPDTTVLANDDVISNDIKGPEREKTSIAAVYKDSDPANTALVSGKGWHITVTLKDTPAQLSTNEDSEKVQNAETEDLVEDRLQVQPESGPEHSISSSARLSREENNQFYLLLGNTLLENENQQTEIVSQKQSPENGDFSDTDTVVSEQQAEIKFFENLDNLVADDYVRPLTGDPFKELRPLTEQSERQKSLVEDSKEAPHVLVDDKAKDPGKPLSSTSNTVTGSNAGASGSSVPRELVRDLSSREKGFAGNNLNPSNEVFSNQERDVYVIQEESWAFTSHSSNSNFSVTSSENSTVSRRIALEQQLFQSP